MRPDLLRALEREEFDEIGHQSFVRTHLHSYARFLGIDAGEVVEKFERQQPEPLPSALDGLDRTVRTAKHPPRAKWLVAAGISALVLILAAVAGLLGGQAERPTTDAMQKAITSPVTASHHAVTTFDARVTLRIDAVAATQLNVLVDGHPFYQGDVTAGDTKVFRGRSTIEIVVAKADAVKVSLNGTAMPALGPPGEVARAKFGPNGRID